MSTKNADTPDYPVFKGLQRPFELMGLQGRYIKWAVITAVAAIVLFIVTLVLFGTLSGIIAFAAALGAGGATIMIKQQKGLHSKKIYKGSFVFSKTKSI